VGIVFRLEHIGSADLAATTHLGTNLGQVSLLFVFREEPRFVLNREGQRKRRRERRRRRRK
jgi:hypothetical protein